MTKEHDSEYKTEQQPILQKKNSQMYDWLMLNQLIELGMITILVFKPKNSEIPSLDTYQQVSHYGHVFDDLHMLHQVEGRGILRGTNRDEIV